MEAAQFDSRCPRQRRRRYLATLHSWLGPALSRSRASSFHRTESVHRVRRGRYLGRRPFRAPYAFRLRRRRLFSEVEISLDVVAGYRWIGNRPRWFDLSASAWSWLRHDWWIAPRNRNH